MKILFLQRFNTFWTTLLRFLKLRPLRMYRRKRPEDQNFRPSEDLYMRYKDRGFSIPTQPAPSAAQIIRELIRPTDQSVIRSKYSQPEDVLFPGYFSWGILAFPVSDIPGSLFTGTGILIQFKLTHVPLWNNYAHSEIRAFGGQSHKRRDRLSNGVRREFRRRMKDGNARIIKHPS